jgi:flagellar assembly protein FliH
MTEPRRFSFDQDFGDAARVTPAGGVRRKRVYLADEVDAIRAAAVNEGESSIASRAKAQDARSLAEIADAARKGLDVLGEVAREHRVVAAELALAVARKIAGAALDRFPEAPIKAALETLGREIESQARLVVRVGEPSDAVRSVVETAAADIGFAGQIVFRAEDGLPTAAFVIEWADGRASFDPNEAMGRIAQSFEAALAADGVHGEPLPVASARDASSLPPTGA